MHNGRHATNERQRLVTAAAWAAILVIAYATLTKVGFVYAIYFKLSPYLMRPQMQTYAHFEHIIAFAILGTLFGLAYPGARCWSAALCLVPLRFWRSRRR